MASPSMMAKIPQAFPQKRGKMKLIATRTPLADARGSVASHDREGLVFNHGAYLPV
jgi:hypothetical protein